MGLNDTPTANRIHIGIFGKRNAGKSSLINYISNQDIALISDVPGTTTDPVSKAMEVTGVGACVFIDTAGFDDNDKKLGRLRISRTKSVISKTDIAILIITDDDLKLEEEWATLFNSAKIPYFIIINKVDELNNNVSKIIFKINNNNIFKDVKIVLASTKLNIGKDEILSSIKELSKNITHNISITKKLVKPQDKVVLVMPQDAEAPKGRLILPQVQIIRDLLDNQCIPICCQPSELKSTLSALKTKPDLVITDSQVFKEVYDSIEDNTRLTSFSVLLAEQKGDISTFIDGANRIDNLTEQSKILIAEACTHAPLSEDIGTVKIPTLLRKKFGDKLTIDFCSGVDFPENLSEYDLVIHCGSCMYNRRFMLSRIALAQAQNVPITNYGITIAKLKGILDKVIY